MATAQTIDRPLPQSAKQAGDIDDIIVTAEHRCSSVQDTPIAVSAFEAQKLSNQGIVSAEGLSQVAPTLQLCTTHVNNDESIIRGIGKANEDLATDAGVALYLNGDSLPQ